MKEMMQFSHRDPAFVEPSSFDDQLNKNEDVIIDSSYAPDKKTVGELKKFGEEHPEKMDVVLKLWAKEAGEKVRKFMLEQQDVPPLLSKEEVNSVLANIENTLVEKLDMYFAEAIETDRSKWLLGYQDFVKDGVEIYIQHFLTSLHITLNFTEIEGVKQGIDIMLEVENSDPSEYQLGEWSFRNIHRSISPNLQGLGIGRWFEKIVEDRAKKMGISRLQFDSGQLYNSVVFPLTQGYVCENTEDRERVLDFLKTIYDHPEKYNNAWNSRYKENTITFEKNLKA